MKMIALDSTTLRSAGYDSERRLLRIEFHDRSEYDYFEVPATVLKTLLQAPSKGAYFNHSIRRRFAYALVKEGSLS